MSEHAGRVPGETGAQRASALAGCLAELGVTDLVLVVDGAEVRVRARATDLPALVNREVARTGEARILAPALGATFRLSADGGSWTCASDHGAKLLRERLHA